MWIFRGFVFLILLFALVYFFVENRATVDIKLFGTQYLDISIYWVVVVSYLMGFATSFLLAAFREFRFHREIGRLKKDAVAKDREIADLRTLPLRQEAAPPAEADTGE